METRPWPFSFNSARYHASLLVSSIDYSPAVVHFVSACVRSSRPTLEKKPCYRFYLLERIIATLNTTMTAMDADVTTIVVTFHSPGVVSIDVVLVVVVDDVVLSILRRQE